MLAGRAGIPALPVELHLAWRNLGAWPRSSGWRTAEVDRWVGRPGVGPDRDREALSHRRMVAGSVAVTVIVDVSPTVVVWDASSSKTPLELVS